MVPAPARKVLEIDDPVTKIATVSSLGQIGGGEMSSCAPARRSPHPAARAPPPAAAVRRRSWRARQAQGAGVALGDARGAAGRGFPGCERALDVLCDILDVTEDMGLMFAAVNAVGTIGTSNPDFAPKVRAHLSKTPRAHARACGRRGLLTRAGGRRASRRCGV
jgi:hypothetical protein